ncbi:hypothetical protein HPP92_015994 [Vanilla planifolia]|uniref:Uncharacterized protein n=1 Tax=Vanilla planifolia TaxID=51239 RepID=A0A835QSN3_VANPL|nr:hypothetical protein HPP92_015994 [Vanilla planifolia]
MLKQIEKQAVLEQGPGGSLFCLGERGFEKILMGLVAVEKTTGAEDIVMLNNGCLLLQPLEDQKGSFGEGDCRLAVKLVKLVVGLYQPIKAPNKTDLVSEPEISLLIKKIKKITISVLSFFRYAADAYAIFCAGKPEDVVPEDYMLVKYWEFVVNWRSKQRRLAVEQSPTKVCS